MLAHKLNLLHLLLLPSAAACLYFAWWEGQRRTIRLRRIFWGPWAAVFVALLLVFFQTGMKQPLWPFLATLGVGLVIGGMRGLTMKLEVDEYWLVVRPAARRTIVWIAALLAVVALVDIGGAAIGSDGKVGRYYAALAAMGCSGLLLGRAIAVAVRVWRLIG